MPKLNAQQLRTSQPTSREVKEVNRQPITIILDNVLDTFNIGSFFRLADALAVEKIYLCGKTVTPPNVKVHRSSIGTWKWVPWEHHSSTLKIVKKLKREGYLTVAAEQAKNSLDYRKVKIKKPLAVIAGHETNGINSEVLKEVDVVAEIPMLGINRSLNVLVAASVILYNCLDKLGKNPS